MKIRTKLLAFLLPFVLASTILVATFLSFHWKREISSHYSINPNPTIATKSISNNQINEKLQNGYNLILISSISIVAIMALAIYSIANKISKPINKLSNAALSIAAGNYEENISLTKAPKEIGQLANTFNTMSQCLLENTNRLKEGNHLYLKNFQEKTTHMALQNYLLDKALENCSSDIVAIKPITIFSNKPTGYLLSFPKDTQDFLKISIERAENFGLDSFFDLITYSKNFLFKPFEKKDACKLTLNINLETTNVLINNQNFENPIFWSTKNNKIISASDKKILLEKGDYIILNLFDLEKNSVHKKFNLNSLITKVFSFFSEDGLTTCTSMLQKELIKQFQNCDIHLICFQILY
jgi:HAMP domain-containing protein